MKALELAALVAGVAVQPAFPEWERVDVSQILKPVPAIVYKADSLGSVQKFPKSETLPDACAIVEGRKVVGYRLTCN